tara:strand:- start:299 stop:1561 length:1263 start_codon:yes stop_codon:yes gene_type:complete
MALQKFTSTWINKVPYSSNRTLYIDSSPDTKFHECDLVLIVGKQSKTAYLRHRPTVNGIRKSTLHKIGDANVIPLYDLKQEYEKQVIQIKTKESPILVEKKFRDVTLGHLIDFYLQNKSSSDADGLVRLKSSTYTDENNRVLVVGDVKCKDLDVFGVKDILQDDVDKGSLYVANQKKEFIRRVWNYALGNHKSYNKVLKLVSNPATFSMKDWVGFTKKASTIRLDKEDYPQFFEAVNSLHRSDFKDLLYMFLFTGQHPYSEVCMMRWDQIKEIDGQYWWLMEEGFHKTQYAHSFPLHPMVMDIINKYKGSDETYVFKNIHSKVYNLHNKHTFKNILRGLRKTHNITWDIRCLRASFVTTISEIDLSFRSGILTNHKGQNITEKNYIRGDITYYDFKVNMINAYMDLIQDKLNETSRSTST